MIVLFISSSFTHNIRSKVTIPHHFSHKKIQITNLHHYISINSKKKLNFPYILYEGQFDPPNRRLRGTRAAEDEG